MVRVNGREFGRTVSQLFDAQPPHLLTATLPEAAVGQVFLNGFVSRMIVGINSLTGSPNVPWFLASGESGPLPCL